MKPSPVNGFLFAFFLFHLLGTLCLHGAAPAIAQEGNSSSTESTLTLKMIGEDRDVGLKRMEILEKTLSPELLERKRAFVRSREREYNEKIGILVQRLTTNMGRNTVITHVDVDYFAVDFEPRVQAEENVTVTILVDEDGLGRWEAGRGTREAALEEMQTLIHGAFRIPMEQIKIVVAPN